MELYIKKKKSFFVRARDLRLWLCIYPIYFYFSLLCCFFFSWCFFSAPLSVPFSFYIIYLLGDFRNERLANGARKMKRAKLSFHSLAQNVISSKSHAIEITTFIDSITGHNIFSLCECCCCECWIFFTKRWVVVTYFFIATQKFDTFFPPFSHVACVPSSFFGHMNSGENLIRSSEEEAEIARSILNTTVVVKASHHSQSREKKMTIFFFFMQHVGVCVLYGVFFKKVIHHWTAVMWHLTLLETPHTFFFFVTVRSLVFQKLFFNLLSYYFFKREKWSLLLQSLHPSSSSKPCLIFSLSQNNSTFRVRLAV